MHHVLKSFLQQHILHSKLQAQADVNTDSPLPPLSAAAHKGLAECIACLLTHGANPHVPDEVSYLFHLLSLLPCFWTLCLLYLQSNHSSNIIEVHAL